MKKAIFTLLVMVAIATSSRAQLIDEGTIMAGGSLEFTTEKNDNIFILNPMLGYSFVDQTMLGISLSYSSISKLNAFSIGPFARYYLNFGLFAHAGLSFEHLEQAENKNDLDLILGLGYAAFLNDNVALEPLFTVHLLDGNAYTRLGISLQIYFNR